jgi:putative transposase
MPWKEQRVVSLRIKFIEAAVLPGANISALCREFSISRQTAYKWLRRYRALGDPGLVDQSRRPLCSPASVGEEIVREILLCRAEHDWGPDTISGVLAKKLGAAAPSRATVARVLKRAGKVKKRRSPVRVWSVAGKPQVEVHGPNDLWTIDFKGWWRAGNGERCEPFTVRDACSRFVLAASLVSRTSGSTVRRVLERLFREHGTPRAMLCDNGSPWVSMQARGGLTALSVWLVSLGIRLYRSRPGCPQDNGGHERMHRDFSELQLRPASTRAAQQRDCDRWRTAFNHVRPHLALGGRTPAEVYRPTERRAPEPRSPTYSDDALVRRVSGGGNIFVDGDTIFVGTALRGHLVGLTHQAALRWRAHFFDVDLGLLEIAPLNELQLSNPNEGPTVTAVSA